MTPLKAICYILFAGLNFAVYIVLLLEAFRSALRFSRKKTTAVVVLLFAVGAVFEVLVFERESPFYAYCPAGQVFMAVLEIAAGFLLIRKQPVQVSFGIFMTLTIQSNVVAAAQMVTDLAPLPVLCADFPNLNYLIYTLAVLLAFLPLLHYLFARLLRRGVEVGINLERWSVLLLLRDFIRDSPANPKGCRLQCAVSVLFCMGNNPNYSTNPTFSVTKPTFSVK